MIGTVKPDFDPNFDKYFMDCKVGYAIKSLFLLKFNY